MPGSTRIQLLPKGWRLDAEGDNHGGEGAQPSQGLRWPREEGIRLMSALMDARDCAALGRRAMGDQDEAQ